MRTERNLYGLSLITGLIGTVLTVESEMKDSKDDAAVSHRALYAFILWVAGLLWMASRIAASPKTQAASLNKAVAPPHSPSSSPSPSEDNPEIVREEKSGADSPASDSGSGVALLELKPAEAKETKRERKPTEADDDSKRMTVEEITYLSSASLSSMPIPSLPMTGWRRYLSSGLSVAQDLIPTAWFAQSLTLFLQNALEESVTSNLLPYTALSGLATGYLFCISIKPWQLFGIRRWIENHRNELVIPENMLYALFLSFRLLKPYFLYAVTTASFWTGYNLEELITLITTKSIQRSSASRQPTQRLKNRELLILPRLSTSLLISLGGLVCSGLSLLVIQSSITHTDQALRNEAAVWMASIGNYAFTYPLGIYLGRYLPRRYHNRALTAATYLLVPFASPELTIPHYLLLMGGGLCGGVAHFILKTQYHRQLAKMQRRKQLTDDLLEISPLFLNLLSQLSLPNDLLLQRYQQKKRKMTIIIKITVILLTANVLYRTITDTTMIQRIVDIIGFLTNKLIYIGGFYLLPRGIPSIYQLTPLSLLKQFFYRDSFSMIFLLKIGLILSNKINLRTFGNGVHSDKLLNISLFVPTFIPTAMKLLFKREQGYQVYIPHIEDIKQLAAALKPEALSQRLKSAEPRLSCSYHLLKFMQENPPALSRIRSFSGSQSPVAELRACSKSL